MKKAKPARNIKPATNTKKRSSGLKRGFPLQLFFSFYTTRYANSNTSQSQARLSPLLSTEKKESKKAVKQA
jgi:hypothetical protein